MSITLSKEHPRFVNVNELATTSGALQTNIDNHTSSGTIHFTEASIDKYTQAEVDSLIASISGTASGTTDHSLLDNLTYSGSGHTGFQPSGDYATNSKIDTASGTLQSDIDNHTSTTSGNPHSILHSETTPGDGSDHTYINQDVTTTSTPRFERIGVGSNARLQSQINMSKQIVDPGSGEYSGLYGVMTFKSNTVRSSAIQRGLNFYGMYAGDYGAEEIRASSTEAYANISSSGTINYLIGGLFTTGNLSTNATITNTWGLRVTHYSFNNGGTITNYMGMGVKWNGSNITGNSYGVKLDANTDAGSPNKYGLYVGDVSGGVYNYSIYTQDGIVYHEDSVGIGTDTPTNKLDVVGGITAESLIISGGTTSGIDHTDLDNIGTYTHAQIDSYIEAEDSNTHWTVVSGVTEFEAAMADLTINNIYLLNGDYNLTQAIALRDNLHLKGEAVPSDGNNTNLDGARLLYNVDDLFYTPEETTYATGLTVASGVPQREDRYITLDNNLTVDVPAGSIIRIGNYIYDMIRPAASGTNQLNIQNNIAVESYTSGSTVSLYQLNVRNVTIERLMYSGNKDVVHDIQCTKNVTLKDVHIDEFCTGGWGRIEYNINLIFDRCSANDDEDYYLYIRYVNGLKILDCYREGYAGNNTQMFRVTGCIGGEIKGQRGSGFSIYNAFNFEVDNCYSDGIKSNDKFYYYDCHYFSIINCSTNHDVTGFTFNNSSNFMVTGCNAPNATTPIDTTSSSDYKVFGNHWQDDPIYQGDDVIFNDVTVNDITVTGTLDVTSATVSGISPYATGFVDVSNSTISGTVSGSHYIYISPSDTGYTYYIDGNEYTLTSTRSYQVPNVEGHHYIYFDGPTLTGTTTKSSVLYTDNVLVADVYIDATASEILCIGDKRYNYYSNPKTIEYMHETIGLKYTSGGELNLTANSTRTAVAKGTLFTVSGTTFWNGNVEITYPDTVLSGAINIFYREGADSSGIWRAIETSGIMVTPDPGTSNYIPSYNKLESGTWSTDYYLGFGITGTTLVHVVATNDINNKYAIIMGGLASYDTNTESFMYDDFERVAKGPLPFDCVYLGTVKVYYSDGLGGGDCIASPVVIGLNDDKDYLDLRSHHIEKTGAKGIFNHDDLWQMNIGGASTYWHLSADQASNVMGPNTQFINLDVTGYTTLSGSLAIGSTHFNPEADARIHIVNEDFISTAIYIDTYHGIGTDSSELYMRKAASTWVSSNKGTTTFDEVFGTINGQGVNTSFEWADGSQIKFDQDGGTAGSTYVPGGISFSTSDGTTGLEERLRIGSDGNVGFINTTSGIDHTDLDNIGNNTHSQIDTHITNFNQIQTDTGNLTGFVDNTESTITFASGTRTFTIAPTATDFSYYILGTKHTQTSGIDYVIPDTEGHHYIYFDGISLTGTSTFNVSILRDFAFTAHVHWDADNNTDILLGDERHGASMTSRTHQYLHSTRGASLDVGGALGNISADDAVPTDDSTRFSNADITFWDEDIRFNNTTRTVSGTLPIYYRTGVDASNIWRSYEAGNHVVMTTSGTRAAWNEKIGNSWVTTEVANGSYTLAHVISLNDTDRKFGIIMGQSSYVTKIAAQDAATTEVSSLVTAGLPTLEFIFLGTIIIQSNNAWTGNALLSRIVSTGDGGDYIDLREVTITRAGVIAVGSHNELSGIQGGTTNEHYHLDSADYTNLTGGSPVFNDLTLNHNTGPALTINISGTNTVRMGTDINVYQGNHIKGYSDDGISGTPPTFKIDAVSGAAHFLGDVGVGTDTPEEVLHVDGNTIIDGNLTVTSGINNIEIWVIGTEGYQIQNNDRVMLDTTSGTINLNAPLSPVFGNTFRVVDGAGNCSTVSGTIDLNGKKIQGVDEDYVINEDSASVKLVYFNTSRGWVIV